VTNLLALISGHDETHLETARRIAGRWFTSMNSNASAISSSLLGLLIRPAPSTATV
jgi:hypothetical protein